MGTDTRQRNKGRRTSGTFAAIPHAVLDSNAFLSLTSAAVKLLLDVLRQFDGKNNGNLSITYTQMQQRGWRSTSTLSRAKDQLIEHGLIEKTRQGGLSQGRRTCSLFAITWLPINRIEDRNGQHVLDIPPAKVASGKWKENKAPLSK